MSDDNRPSAAAFLDEPAKPSASAFLDEKPPASAFLDQKPSASAFLDEGERAPMISAYTPPNPIVRAAIAIREAMSPVLGETKQQTMEREQHQAELEKIAPGLAQRLVNDPVLTRHREEMRRGEASVLWEQANTPIASLPRAPDVSGVSLTGSPTGDALPLVAGAYNAAAPMVEGTVLTPLGIATLGGVGGLAKVARAGGKLAPFAKATLAAVSGYFAGSMAKDTGEKAAEAIDVLNDPKSTPQEKITAVMAPAVSGVGALAAGAGVFHEARSLLPKAEIAPAEAANIAAAAAAPSVPPVPTEEPVTVRPGTPFSESNIPQPKATDASQDSAPNEAGRTAAMGSSAPRPESSAAERRVAQAEASARESEQLRTEVPAAARNLVKAMPEVSPRKSFLGIRSLFAPQTIDEGASTMAGVIRASLGKEYEATRQADFALKGFQKEFDKTPVARDWQFKEGERLPRNYEVMRAIDTGDTQALTPVEQMFTKQMRAELDKAIDAVHEVSPDSLRSLVENYFPRIWKDPEANGPTIKLLSHRPWEGPKSFLKQRVLEYFTDGLKMGLRPVSDNPVDVTLQKLGEMYRFATARRAIEEAKTGRLRKFKYVYEPMPEGWRSVDDPTSNVWAPPTVTVKEAYDAQMRAKTIEMLSSLGIPHERVMSLGGERWGQAQEKAGIKTKFGGPDFVFWHEAGHMLDWRFPELRGLTGAIDRGGKGDQMRALADLRFEGEDVSKSYQRYVRKTEEKIANMFDAYVRAPEKFNEVAPDVWRSFNDWLLQHPEVKRPLDEIRPSLRIGSDAQEKFVGGPIKLGDWIMPEGAAQVLDNYLQPGLGRYAAFRNLRDISGLANGAQLLGFFHGQFVLNDSFYSGLGLGLYDALRGKPVRALKEIAQVPISPVTSWWRGRKIASAIENPAAANAEYKKIADLAVEANLRAGHGNYDPQFARNWMRAFRELRAAPSTGAAWETLYRAPMAAAEMALKPVMQHLVPPMKLGIFARMAERVMADNPGANKEVLRQKLAEAADATEDRLGQVTYDNLFQRRAIKDAAQLALRAYGWQLTKYRMMAGGAADWAKFARDTVTGQKGEVTFRMSYLPAMVAGHAILGATLQYLLTGKPPEKPMDYLFPETGLIDKLGRPVRVSIADFVKDVAADWRSFPNVNRMGAEWTRKLAPFWNMAAEMYQNRDFWGTEIFSERQTGEPETDHVLNNVREGVEYLERSVTPFSVRAGEKFQEAGATSTASRVAPFVGFVPAPRYATETPMQSYLGEARGNDYTRTREQAQAAKAASDLSAAIRSGKPLTPEQAQAALGLSKRRIQTAEQKASLNPDVWAIRGLDLDRAMRAFDLAHEDERAKIGPELWRKLANAYKSGGHAPDKLGRYAKLLAPYATSEN